MSDFEALLAVAERTARRAGAALRENRAGWGVVAGVDGREVKVDADVRAEAMIVADLQAATAYPILSEEAGWIAGRGDDLVWAVDPLDGSVNYVQGYPHCAVSIALASGREPILGVVYNFMIDECFTGLVGAGGGAWLNGAAMRVSSVADPNQGVLNTGIPARAKTDEATFQGFMLEMLKWRKVRMIGSAAAALAYVAAGRADAYRETGSMFWDVAGGCALVRAAGGVVTIEGEALDKPLTVRAGNGRVVV